MRRFLAPVRDYGVTGALSRALSNPSGAYRYLLDQDQGRVLPKRQFERPPTPTELETFVTDLGFAVSRQELCDVWLDLCDDEAFRSEVSEAFAATSAGPAKFYHNWRDVVYVLVRVMRPTQVVETGVRGGLSSAYILNALAREDRGRLVSIDVGETSILPDDLETPEPGWIVPQRLRSRWDLRIADSVTELPSVLDETTDLFLSDVPNDILREELAIAAQNMQAGAVVVTCYPQGSEAETIWREFADGALTATAKATRWESREGRSDLCAGVLADHPEFSPDS